jgi:hypothetical protein
MLDNLGRTPIIKKQIGTARKITASDTTLSRLFNNQLEIPDNLAAMVLKEILPLLPPVEKKRLLIVDGSGQGGRLYSVAALNWNSPVVVGIEKQEKHGKELPVSRELIERLCLEMGEWFDLIVGDALYFDAKLFKAALTRGKHLFVKTREENLEIVQFTESVYRVEKASEWKKTKERERFDNVRGVFYKVFMLEGYEYRDLSLPLSCYRVEERDPKTGKREVFFCITTAPDISRSEAREIAKSRWQIENNVFPAHLLTKVEGGRHGNQLFHTKRKFFRNDDANRKYLTLLYLLLGLFQLLFVQALHAGVFTPHSMNLKAFIELTISLYPPAIV